MVGIPGIEPGVGFPDGVTVRSRTLRGDAQFVNAAFRTVFRIQCKVFYIC